MTRTERASRATFGYKGDTDETRRHIGPMAQDFHRAFPLNGVDTRINMSDLDGVTLAGVHALEARTRKLQAELNAKTRKIESLEGRIARLEALIEKNKK